eukprot:Platyproteum_vivax@DN1725_c0_g1_i1.p1
MNEYFVEEVAHQEAISFLFQETKDLRDRINSVLHHAGILTYYNFGEKGYDDQVDWSDAQSTPYYEISPWIAVHIRFGFLDVRAKETVRHNMDHIPQFVNCTSVVDQILRETHMLWETEIPVFVLADNSVAKAEFIDQMGKSDLAVKMMGDNLPEAKHMDRSSNLNVAAHMQSWVEFFMMTRASCIIASESGFSTIPVTLSRDKEAKYARCFAKFNACSKLVVTDSMNGYNKSTNYSLP